MALWIKNEDGSVEKAAGGGSDGSSDGSPHDHDEYALTEHDHDYLPLAGGTVAGDLEVDGTVATSNPGSEGAPAFTSTLYPTTGMYGHAEGVFFAVDGQWKFGAWADRVGIRHDLQVDGQVATSTKFVGTPHGVYNVPPYSFAGREDTGLFAGVDQIGLSNDGNYKLVCYNDYALVTTDLQVDGQLNFGAHALGPIINLFHNPDGSNKYGFGLNTNLVAFWAGGKQVGGFNSLGNLYLDGAVLATRGVAFNIATGIDTADVLDRAEVATMPVVDDDSVATTDADVDVLTVNEVVTAMLAKIKELSAEIEELKGA